jgi:hypothetical protein
LSLYGLLAFLPYTNRAFIEAPAERWVPWLVSHYASIYVVGVCLLFASESKQHWRRAELIIVAGFLPFFLFRPLPVEAWKPWTFLFALLLLVPTLIVSWFDLTRERQEPGLVQGTPSFLYSTTLIWAGIATTGFAVQTAIVHSLDAIRFPAAVTLLVWSACFHLLVATACWVLIQMSLKLAARSSRPQYVFRLTVALLLWVITATALAQFTAQSLSFRGVLAYSYSALLVLATLCAALSVGATVAKWLCARHGIGVWHAGAFVVAGLLLTSYVRAYDWNFVFQAVTVLITWVAALWLAFELTPKGERHYTFKPLAAAAAGCVFGYFALQATQVWWSRSLGATDDEIQRTVKQYAGQNASFRTAAALLEGPDRSTCDELCGIVRQHTNIETGGTATPIELVSELRPASKPPHVFVFVIDSLRPDYLGAYSSKVDFTPELDKLAKDSVIFRNAFTPYAGTTLAEPAIWTGALLLHKHFLQPFSSLNSLQKLIDVNGYTAYISQDTVLKQIGVSPKHLVRLDADQQDWGRFDLCHTLADAEQKIKERGANGPIFFYAQPINVHQFGKGAYLFSERKGYPSGFDGRIASRLNRMDACFGRFVDYLKEAKIYDDSVIVVTSDHGDALGEYGRYSHSSHLYPEVVRIPLIIKVPREMNGRLQADERRPSFLIDIVPTMYALLGYDVKNDPLFGRPLFASRKEELERYYREDFFLASDVNAVVGILSADGRYLYSVYDSPAQSFLYDLEQDPDGLHNLLTPEKKLYYDQRVITHLQQIAKFYDYRPSLNSFVAQMWR